MEKRKTKRKSRYYNLKQGKPGVNGSALRVDPDAKIEDRLRCMSRNIRIELTRYDKKHGSDYELWYEPDYIPREMGNLMMVGERSKEPIELQVDTQGNLRVLMEPKHKKVFLSEITQEEAEKLAEGAACWRMMQMWI